NSFHMVVARWQRGRLHVIDRLRDSVRLGAGLNADGSLKADARERALRCLARFGQRLRGLESRHVRAVATNTVRQLRAPQAFLITAETALGLPIGVASGREEARLIYLGVARDLPANGERRLVVDIGGGSTEFIIGSGLVADATESVQMGCIATTRRFFADGRLGVDRWNEVQTALSLVLQQFAADYRRRGWDVAIGSSGTIKSIGATIAAAKPGARGISRDGLDRLVATLLGFARIADIRIEGLNGDRLPVIAGGIAILQAAFRALDLDRMQVSQNAMREGVLFDLLGRVQQRDPRASSVEAMAERYGGDLAQSERVRATASALLAQVAADWSLEAEHAEWLDWACRLHEIGLAIAHSQHHVHGAYLIEHSDLPGFGREEQQAVALLVRAHRRAIPVTQFGALPERLAGAARRLTVLLRLAALLHRSRTDEPLPEITLDTDGDRLRLHLPADWLEGRSLTRADLELECDYLKAMGIELEVVPVGGGIASG
ncbi:MAG TPA: Ppx/GppA phosphatase family protein, partial [Xanthomonadaceae bacterium]|nr:Ppx/GppA phosphatase family protein [Xanthomonadaceae bacterium]